MLTSQKYFWIVPYISSFQISFVLAQGSNLSITEKHIQHKSVPERIVKYETKNKAKKLLQYSRAGVSW